LTSVGYVIICDMSMNIHINSIGEITYPSGIKKHHIESFNCNQTPTKITNEILASPNPIQAYKDWVMSYNEDEQIEEYDYATWDDKLDYYTIIGYKTVNYGKEHCEELDKFINDATVKGMKLDIYSM